MTHYIFIDPEGKSVPRTNLKPYGAYSYVDGWLTVWNREREVGLRKAFPHDAFVIVCEKGKVFLNNMEPPEKNGALVSWLMKFNKDNRAKSVAEYNIKKERERKRHVWSGYKECEYISQGYIFTLCNSRVDDNVRNVAGFFSDAISKEEVMRLIPLMVYHPDWYIQKLLYDHFKITEKEFQEARKKIFLL